MTGLDSIAIGKAVQVGNENKSDTDANRSIAIGNEAINLDANGAVLLGGKTKINEGKYANNAILIGEEATVTGIAPSISTPNMGGQIAIGHGAKVKGSKDTIAIGKNALSDGDQSISIGAGAQLLTRDSIGIGYNTKVLATATSSITLGNEAIAESKDGYNIVIGNNSKARRSGSVIIGTYAEDGEDNNFMAFRGTSPSFTFGQITGGATLIGSFTRSDSSSTTAVGYGAWVRNQGIAIGYDADANGGIAIGNHTASSRGGSNSGKNIAIGDAAFASGDRIIAIGYNTHIDDSTVSYDSNLKDIIAIGSEIRYEGSPTTNESIIIGKKGSVSRSSKAVVIGSEATILDSSSASSDKNMVALGAGTTLDSRDIISGNAVFSGERFDRDHGVVAIGKRQIVQLAGGIQDDHAVNVGQLKAAVRKFNIVPGTGISAVNKASDTVEEEEITFSRDTYTIEAHPVKIQGNVGNTVSKNLGETLNVTGEGTLVGATAAHNIRTREVNGGLEIGLAESLVGINSIAGKGTSPLLVRNGDTTITMYAPTTDSSGNRTNGSISVGGASITNVGDGVNDGDAVNMKQLRELASNGGATGTAGSTEKVKALESGDNLATVSLTNNQAYGSQNAEYVVSVKKSDVQDVAKGAITLTGGNNVSVNKIDTNGVDTYTIGMDTALSGITSIAGAPNTGKLSFAENGVLTVEGSQPILLDGEQGHVRGLNNTTWNVDNPTIVSGRAATEDQLKTIADRIGTKSSTDYRLVANPEANSNGVYKPNESGTINLTVQDRQSGETSTVTVSDVASKTALDEKADKSSLWSLAIKNGDTLRNVTPQGGTTGQDNKRIAIQGAGGVSVTEDNGIITIGANPTGFTSIETTVSSTDSALTVTDTGTNGNHAYTIEVNKQAIVNGAQIPVVYTTKSGEVVTLGEDGKFYDGTGTEVEASHVEVRFQSADASTTTSTVVNNVGSAIANTIVPDENGGSKGNASFLEKLGEVAKDGNLPNAAVNVGDLHTATTEAIQQSIEAATNKGLSFRGNEGNDITKKLGETLNVTGEGTLVGATAAHNIRTREVNGGLEIGLAESLVGINSIAGKGTSPLTIKNGDTAITIHAPTTDDNGNTVAGSVSLNGAPLTNVGDGLASNDAVNRGQLEGQTAELRRNINRLGANAAAMAALHPLQYDPLEPSQVLAGVGSYKGKQALALGLAHYTNESTMVTLGVSMGSKDNMVNAGISHKFGFSEEKKDVPDRYKGGPISSIYIMQDEVTQLKQENEEVKAAYYQLAQENAEMKSQIHMLMQAVGLQS